MTPVTLNNMHFQILKPLCCSTMLISVFGCTSAQKYHHSAIEMFDRGEASQAVNELDKAAEQRGAELEIISIDRAIAGFMAGDVKWSESELNRSRKQIDFLRQKDVREQTVAVLSDDKSVAWSGREFEQRMIDNLLVLASLAGDRQDAFAFASQGMKHVSTDRQTIQSLTGSINNIVTVGHETTQPPTPPPPIRFAPNALTAYLAAAIHSEIPMNADITDKAVADVTFWTSAVTGMPNSTANPVSPLMTELGVRSKAGHGVVHVITLVGRATDWQAETAAPTSTALLLTDQILSAVGKHTLPPTVAPVKIARPVRRCSIDPFAISAEVVDMAHIRPINSVPIVDLNRSAWDSYLSDRDRQLARAVARRIIKKGTVYAAKDQLAISNDSGADLLINLGGIAWEALEKPDTRHVNLLPERIDVLQMELPDGVHELKLRTSLAGKPTPSTEKIINVSIENGKNTFIICFRTGDRITAMVSP